MSPILTSKVHELKVLCVASGSILQVSMNDLIVWYIIIPMCMVFGFAVGCVYTDFTRHKIYNAVTFPMMLAGLLFHLSLGIYFQNLPFGIVWSVVGLLFGLAILIVPWLLGVMGGGDVKMMGAVGAWLGAWLTFWIFAVSAIAAGCLSVILIVLHQTYGETWERFQLTFLRLVHVGIQIEDQTPLEEELDKSDRRKRVIPFGVALFAGIIVVSLLLYFQVVQLGLPTPQ